MNEKIKEIRDIINKLEGKEILIDKIICLVADGDIQYDYKNDNIDSPLSISSMSDEQLEDLKEQLKEELEYHCVRKPLKDAILSECNEIISFEDFISLDHVSRYRIIFKLNDFRFKLYESYKYDCKKSIDVKFVDLDSDIIKCIRNM